MELSQTSAGTQLHKLKITGTADELRTLALAMLDAIDNGKHTMRIGRATIKIRRKAT